ncbi:hypothetical protein EU811_13935 [Arthrobacter sp. TS-15]|uniref:hypothetical protein n=1 Tax=Micrococcaceae TaxID=1268 RepID=UPI00115D15FF|nr:MULTISPECIES: hypothetical protein [Micrococcaceae]MCM0617751.1 hypothetical protein [Paenarthrobacter sp. TYUT067]TQS91620.1 hypothetical protein EU811_13935 [Arthrobacter sp. TS-15]
MEQVYIPTVEQGAPAVIVRGGREWPMVVEPVRWFERVAWWEDSRRMPRGQGRVDVEVWQVQIRLGDNPESGIVTWELVRDGSGGSWSVRGEELAAA